MSDEGDELEQAEAEALARALSGDQPPLPLHERAGARVDEVEPPELATAALLRYAGPEGELRDERAEAVLAKLMRQVDAAAQQRVHAGGADEARARARARGRATAWTGGVFLAAAAAVLLVIWTGPAKHAPSATTAPAPSVPASSGAPLGGGAVATVPAPTAALLAAQAGVARPTEEPGRARFDGEMRAYRAALLRALERAYPARVGMLRTGAGR